MNSKKNALKKYQDIEEYDIRENNNENEENGKYGEREQDEEYAQYARNNNQGGDYYYDAQEYQNDDEEQDVDGQDEKQDQNQDNEEDYEEIPNVKQVVRKQQQRDEDEDKDDIDDQDEQDQEDINDRQEEEKEEGRNREEEDDGEEDKENIGNGNERDQDEQLEQDDQDNEGEYDEDEREEFERQQQQLQQQKNQKLQQSMKQNNVQTKQQQKPSIINKNQLNDNKQSVKQQDKNINSTGLKQADSKGSFPGVSGSVSTNYQKSQKSFDTSSTTKDEERKSSQNSIAEPFDSIYNTKKYPFGITDDPELEKERKNLWKEFGRDCQAGRELFSLYKCHQPVKMNYPKVKLKTAQELLPKVKEIKPCPQKMQIDYPPLSYKVPVQKYFKVDFIPKRKPESEIRKELDELRRNPYVPLNRGVDRTNLILNLQKRFKNLRGGLPKAAELPHVDQETMVYDEEMVKTQAQKRVGLKNKMFEKRQDGEKKSVISDDPIAECNQLFDQILAEIEERQEYLDSIEHLKEAALKKRIKQEIIERVAELQKVTEIKQSYSKEGK